MSADEPEGATPYDRADDDRADDGVPLPIPRPRPNGSIVAAAMIGLAIGMGMEPDHDEPTEMVQPAEPDRDRLDLDYGSLPPLDPPEV